MLSPLFKPSQLSVKTEKRFLLSAFSAMKCTVSIRAKHKGLIRISKFCWCVLLPAINGGCKHSCRIKGRMWVH